MSDSTIRALAREIASLKRQVRDMGVASQGAHRSVEEGSIDFYDENGVLRERIGRFADDTYGRRSYGGDPPPAPTEPDVVTLMDGLVAITWDGRFEERYSGDFRNVQVHLGPTADFVPDRNTQEGAIFARRGGTIVCVTESDTDNPVYVRLVASSRAGVISEPSVAVLVDEEDPDELEEEPEELSFEAHDVHVVTAADIAAGVVVQQLSRWPVEESIVAFWNTDPQEPTEYTVDYDAKTITWPLDGVVEMDDRLWVHYTYFAAPSVAILDWGSPGFKYLQTTLDDTADYSGTAFDDSSWATGSAAFGDAATSRSDWNVPSTHWDLATALWVRRTVETGMLATATVSLRLDNEAEVWWNGISLGVFGTTTSSEASIDVPSALLTGTSVFIAVRATDDAVNNTGDRSHFDIRIDGEPAS